MSVVPELSMLELSAERGELLPEREPLQTIGNFSKIAQAGANVAYVSHSEDTQADQWIHQNQDAHVNQDFEVDLALNGNDGD